MKKILSPMEKMRFPESEELPEGVKEIDVKDTFGYCTELYPDVEYAEHSGRTSPSNHDTAGLRTESEVAADCICAGIFLA